MRYTTISQEWAVLIQHKVGTDELDSDEITCAGDQILAILLGYTTW
jgi:hypothetical protein